MAIIANNINVPSGLTNFGTSLTDGIRIGPSAAHESCVPDTSGSHSPIISPPRLNLDQWGPGVYTGGIFTYRIIPAPVSENTTAPSLTSQDNIVREFAFTYTNLGAYLYLQSYSNNPRPTQTFSTNDGEFESIMFDYPRCVNIYVDPDQTASFKVDVWGWDLYGQHMMERIITTAGASVTTGKKAFQGLYAIIINSDYEGAFVQDLYFAVGTSNYFGLPFSLNQASHILGYSQGDFPLQELDEPSWQEASNGFPYYKGGMDVDAVSTNPGIVFLPYQMGSPDFVAGADMSTPTATTGDVRGVFKPGNGWTWNTIDSPFKFDDAVASLNNWPRAPQPWLTFTYYIAGADMYQNVIQAQINNMKSRAADQSIFDGMWRYFDRNVPARNQESMKGKAQYWEDLVNV